MFRRVGFLLVILHCGVASAAFPPSPYDILKSEELETPLLEAVEFCQPEGLDPSVYPVVELGRSGEWTEAREVLARWSEGLSRVGPDLIVFDAGLAARSATDRSSLRDQEKNLRRLLQRDDLSGETFCLRMELARILFRLTRPSEAAAQLTLAERAIEADALDPAAIDVVAFTRAEILYQRGIRFDAHLAYRKLAKSKDRRLAAGARLRLTDLSFDSGKTERVSLEYEALLPRIVAFGGSSQGWALRAAEAALDIDDAPRALGWIEQFLATDPARDAKDAAEIRLADLDVHFDEPLRARNRLIAISGRRSGDRIGTLAAIRAIDLGVSAGSPTQRMEVLVSALRDHRRGLRRYALGVLMRQLAQRDDLDGALAVATRLAYEGIDPVVVPDFEADLNKLLAGVTQSFSRKSCSDVIRALGGRYGILIERASDPEAFIRVGACFEEMELPWLAVGVYRTITRRFGTQGAESITLPLARSSLAIGETALARRIAQAALEQESPLELDWRAVLAEAEFKEGNLAEAAVGLRKILDAKSPVVGRGKLVRLLAMTFENRDSNTDLDFVRTRISHWLRAEQAGTTARENMIEAAILAAHHYRRKGQVGRARELYNVVESYAEAGALRSSARFWLGTFQNGQRGKDRYWGEDPNLTLGTPWARVAQFERASVPLLDAYGKAGR